jgi:hypothetical protein
VEHPVLIGYMRISKADGSQTLDLQRDALLAAGFAALAEFEHALIVERTMQSATGWPAHIEVEI